MVERVVVGAHYGLRDWLVQRITAVVLAVCTAGVVALITFNQPMSYTDWKHLFSVGWMRVGILLFAVSLAGHMWIGMRDILMDYVKATHVRLALQVLVILMIAGYVGWVVEILWR